MSGGTGHMSKLARETALRNQQRKDRIKNFKKSGGIFTGSTMELEFKEVSKEKLENLRQKYLQKLQKEKIKNRLILLGSISIAIPLFIFLLKTFFNQIF
jgi:hypothetical protein